MTTSVEEAHGSAVGFSGHIHGFNADVEFRLAEMLMKVGKWVEQESGVFLGHIKIALSCGDQGLNLNLTDINEGVLHHNSMMPKKKVDFHFMAAVTDVDAHELEHVMMHAMEDSGVDFCIEDSGSTHEHHHDHGDDCECGCHDHDYHDHHHHGHEHHHDHDENCTCGCHDHDHHEHDEDCECGCHDHDHYHDHDHEHHHHHHDHKHHHEHGEDCKCGCHDHNKDE